ncbi:hypothetical protein [Fulvimarina sp. MAC8]|uniref:hypothetical protein n=1 Tax=Fulvimarina sp. MAC8 TaxID=3162874 RepID=UPI0032EB5E96
MMQFRSEFCRLGGPEFLVRILGLGAVALILFGTVAGAQTWRNNGTTSGFYADGRPNGIFLRCSGPSMTVNFTGYDALLPNGTSYRVGISIDGIARLFRTRSYNVRGRSILVHQDSLANLRPLIDDLRKGKTAEITTPAGRYNVPLAGSGAALGALLERCG